MKRLASLILAVILFSVPITASAYPPSESFSEAASAADGIQDWQRSVFGRDISGKAGESVCDWLAFAQARAHDSSESDYAAASAEYYKENREHLSVTDMERLSIAASACGEDISSSDMLSDIFEALGGDLSGKLVNQLIFALLALDSGRYSVPDGSEITREALVDEILSRRLESGALWMMNENTPETDVTAMAVTALAPYVNGSSEVNEAVSEMIVFLSACVTDDGTVKNWGAPSCETTAQTIAALSSLGLSADKDPRFMRGEKTLIDGLLSYRRSDGGFAHSESGSSDPYATAQAYYALAAFARCENGLRTLYDMRPEQPEELQKRISSLDGRLAALETSDTAQAERLLSEYEEIPVSERMYVRRAGSLFILLEENGIENTALYEPDSLALNEGVSSHGTEVFRQLSDSSQSLTAADGTFSSIESHATSPATSSSGRTHGPAEVVLLVVIAAAAAGGIVFNHTVLKKSLNNGRR